MCVVMILEEISTHLHALPQRLKNKRKSEHYGASASGLLCSVTSSINHFASNKNLTPNLML